jgi:hypothetical protein
VLPEFLGVAELDRKVFDDWKVVEVDRAQRVAIIGAGKLERLRIGEDFQSVGSMR